MEILYSSGSGQIGLGGIANIIMVLPFLVSILLALLTTLRNVKINSKRLDGYPPLS
jgi:hypothetical protein